MLRFIMNFILFGILFYLIWMFFPEAFEKLVGWANELYAWATGLFTDGGPAHQPPPPSHP